jgi:serine/threonine protein kinase
MTSPNTPENYSVVGEICYLRGIDQNRIFDMSIHMKYEYNDGKFTLHDSDNIINFDKDENDNKIEIGDGIYGKLYRGTLQSKIKFIPIAIKQIKIKCSESWILCNELLAMYNYNGDNSVKYFGYSQHKIFDHEIHNDDFLEYFIFMEYLSGCDLWNYIYSKNKNNNFEEKIIIMYQLIAGLSDLHDNGIFHRDIKPENIFITRDTNDNILVKYIDFGFSCTKYEYKYVTCSSGTFEFMSPEIVTSIIENHPADYEHFESDDLWALGVTLYYLFYGKSIYNILPNHYSESGILKYYDIFHDISDENIDKLFDINPCFESSAYIPDEIKNTIKKMLRIDPDKRKLKNKSKKNVECCIVS